VTVLLYHFHGLGPYDFSTMETDDLLPLQDLAVERDAEILPTIYLRRERLPQLVDLIHTYGRLRDRGVVPNIAGFAVEGPLLGPDGGIPPAGRWYPTFQEWSRLAELGRAGLRYVVMAPDAMELTDEIAPGVTFADLVLTFYRHGVRVALGHFHRDDPLRSARRVEDLLRFLHTRYQSSRYLVLTDHLYNDMPRAFTHAWRTPEQRERRDAEVQALLDSDWSRENLATLLGPVPAAMLNAALDDLLMPCINFDGSHVDLDVSVRTADLLGDDRLIVLTDHTEVSGMAGEELVRDQISGLRLRHDGAVAAGSSGPEAQWANMARAGMPAERIHKLFYANPHQALDYQPAPLARVR
jgi:hypothetical protein